MKFWTELYTARFGQISLWILLLTASYLVLETHLQYQYLPKGDNLSILGYLLPASFWDSLLVLPLGKTVFFLSALCWALLPVWAKKISLSEDKIAQIAIISAWVCVFGYFFVACTYWENLPWIRHKFVLPFWLLTLNALWYQFYGGQIVGALKRNEFLKVEIYPGWVYGASVFFISVFYTFSGVSKMMAAPDWASGLSLQLWTIAYGDQSSPVARLILEDRMYARILQTSVLSLESLSFLAIFFAPLRVLIAIGLFAFHCAVDMVFSIKIPFESQKILLLLYFLPWFRIKKKQTTTDQNQSISEV
ncbi:MAG: hypothetical protein KIT34_18105 [Cyanobacteria bacterium TGS_CYA1]|nr:hypothetical protein [Cyanobacteria bacterium TGS_CYA1]